MSSRSEEWRIRKEGRIRKEESERRMMETVGKERKRKEGRERRKEK